MFGKKTKQKPEPTKIEVKEISPDFNFLNSKQVIDINWWKYSDGSVKLAMDIKISDYQLKKTFEGSSFEETLKMANDFWDKNKDKLEEISKL